MNFTPDQRAVLAAARRIKADKAKALKRAVKRVRVIEKADRGRVRDRAYLAWLRRQPCVIAAVDCTRPSQAAHLRYGDAAAGRVNPGLQKKPDDRWATPLCPRCHAEQHAFGNERAWWASKGLDGTATAKRLYAQFQGSEQ